MDARFEVVGMVVEDMARSLAFYRRLGLPIGADADDQPHVEVEMPGGLRVAWDTAKEIASFDPSWEPASPGRRGFTPGFAFESPAEVDAMHDGLVAAGYRSHAAPWDAFWGQRYAVVLDPDGNAVDLFAALETGATN
jgi:catechol 2,3-dioxygenase-like lactoylglutathione lyase family enzyme